MKIEKKKVIRKIETEVVDEYLSYSADDIKALVTADAESRGYKVDRVLIRADYKYNRDEWGMSMGPSGYLKCVNVFIGGEASTNEY